MKIQMENQKILDLIKTRDFALKEL